MSQETAEQIASDLYSSQIPYHNFKHALRAIEIGMQIVKYCQEENVPIDKNIVYYALLFHDAGYHKDHNKKGFKTKEEYAAHLAEESLKKLDINDTDFITKVKDTIISTTHNATFESNEAKAVRSSDLAGLAGSYDDFINNNKKLKAEYEMLSGKSISLDQWKEKTKEIIEFYLHQDIHLTSHYKGEDGESIFHKNARKNLKQFLEENMIG